MKAKVYDLNGKPVKEVDLPTHFTERVRPDLIRRAFLAIMSHSRQPYGASVKAGKQHVIRLRKRRHRYRSSYGWGISRIPRKIMAKIGAYFNWVGAFAPNTRGGRRAHPPKVEKVWEEKINDKERRKAIRSAIAATALKEFVTKRHRINVDVPIVVEDKVEELKKTKEVEKLLKALKLEAELERTKEKKIRAGKGKMRGRKYKRKVGPLFVVSKKCALLKAARNIAGVDAVQVKDLNVGLLAPGAQPGRLVIWSESALKKLEGLFK